MQNNTFLDLVAKKVLKIISIAQKSVHLSLFLLAIAALLHSCTLPVLIASCLEASDVLPCVFLT